ncbi:MAG: hypothetical protein JEY79_10945 [Pseudodesulfovibrio sp.]|nr:hypothetical protein [Pseudodesulfovibrio sp.]
MKFLFGHGNYPSVDFPNQSGEEHAHGRKKVAQQHDNGFKVSHGVLLCLMRSYSQTFLQTLCIYFKLFHNYLKLFDINLKKMLAFCASIWHIVINEGAESPKQKENKMIISSQRYINEEIVAEKIEAADYVVSVSREFGIDGETYRVIIDGHHSLEAATRTGSTPEFEEVETETDSLLDIDDINGFLDDHYVDCYWYNIETGREIW